MRVRLMSVALAGLVITGLAGYHAIATSGESAQAQLVAAALPHPSSNLSLAVERTDGVDFAFAAGGDGEAVAGARDVQTGAAAFVHEDYDKPMFLSTSTDLYQEGLDGFPGSPVRMNVEEMSLMCRYSVAADPLVGLSLLGTAAAVEQFGSSFTGTVDVAALSGSPATQKAAEYLAALAGSGTGRFTASVNGAGYLTAIGITFSGEKGEILYSLRMSDHGMDRTLVIPNENVIEAPGYLYG